MKYRHLVFFCTLTVVIAGAAVSLTGQAPRAADNTAAPATWTPPRTAWGDPDLQGIWRNMMTEDVPLQRPKELGTKAFWTDAELAAKIRAEEERRAALPGRFDLRPARVARGFPGGAGAPPPPSQDPIRIARRTSAIIDPPNGRLPPWTAAQIARYEAREQARWDRGEDDSWEDRSWVERCLPVVGPAVVAPLRIIDPYTGAATIFADGPYSIPPRRILQMPGYVAIVIEETGAGLQGYHLVPLDGRPAPGPQIETWRGLARGRWEGNTLVVETTNVNDQQDGGRILPAHEMGMHPGSGKTLRVIERFTRLDADTLEYRYTVEDPVVYTRPFTAVRELTRDDDFAMVPAQCQENNEGFVLGMLAAGQADELGTLEFAREAAQRRLQKLEELKTEWAEFNALYPAR